MLFLIDKYTTALSALAAIIYEKQIFSTSVIIKQNLGYHIIVIKRKTRIVFE